MLWGSPVYFFCFLIILVFGFNCFCNFQVGGCLSGRKHNSLTDNLTQPTRKEISMK
jgi:hypothetical protein